MTNLNDVLLAMSNIPVVDPIAEIWGRGLQGRYEIIEYTGTLPITINVNGNALLDYQIYGNTVQNGTPTPENPIMPIGCGVRTENLLNLNRTYSNSFTTDTTKWMNGAATTNYTGTGYAETEILGDLIKVTSKTHGYGASFLIEASPNTAYTVSFETDQTPSGSICGISERDINGAIIHTLAAYSKSITFTTHDNCAFLNVCFRFSPSYGTVTFSNIMLSEGQTALPYIPYGYKLPILSNSTVTNIYLGEVETTRRIKKLVLDGTDGELTISGRYRILITDNLKGIVPICTHYRGSDAIAYATLQDGCVSVSIQSYLTIYDSRFTTIDEYKNFYSSQYAAGTPVTVWYVLAEPETGIVNEPLMKIGDYSDTIDSTQANVQIPTSKGTTTLDYDGALKPSQMYIKYLGVKK